MTNEIYSVTFAALVLANAALIWHGRRTSQSETSQETLELPLKHDRVAGTRFKRIYFSVYALAVAADWLQGPYLYTLYKDEKAIAESTVAALFTTGFVTAGVTASFVGSLADRHGRRKACLGYCIAYSLSCLSVLSTNITVLFAGRALGGLSTTLLYSVFETWMVAEYHARELEHSLSLGSMFSVSVTLSSTIAILAGVVGETMVHLTGTKSSPFIAALVCLVAAGSCIQSLWTENYGTSSPAKENPAVPTIARPSAFRVLTDRRIFTLIATTTLFEGPMYLFIFFWSPAIIYARPAESPHPPFGLIFAAFMSAMSFGSLLTSLQHKKPGGKASTADPKWVALTLLPLASTSLLVPASFPRSEAWLFMSFVVFELCVGSYFPTMGKLKSELVADEVRGFVYTVMRVPLNMLVVLVLGGLKEGVHWRSGVFTGAGGGLLLAVAMIHWGLQ